MWLIVCVLTLTTYPQEQIAASKQRDCSGNSSRDAHRSADAAIIDGLYSKVLISVLKNND